MNNTDIFEHIKSLELALLDEETRKNRQQLERILADEFIEIGASGTRYTKKDIIKMLNEENSKVVSMSVPHINVFSDELAQFTYQTSVDSKNTVYRSSLWKKQGDRWQIIFHQGTRMGTGHSESS